jgi:aspartyl-tRNA(Asn)/glutamyl-tRNA(Gln) amidotransferase subunit B
MPKKLEPTIGLEIHSELKTNTKMFCACLNNPDEKEPNKSVCPVCMGHPGTLPTINKEAVRKVIKAGLALNCQIAKESKFDRKNYFYPDLPKGYQISQYDKPFCEKGFLEIGDKKIRITRIHLEEDTGRLIHPEGSNHSLVDFNRAGVPLMELVTEPDMSSAVEVVSFAQELQLILRYLNISDANMEKGQMRVEANISVAPKGKMGTKVEIKNLNSFKAVEKAIEYEIKRQRKALESGEKVVQETRGWDEIKQETFSQRIKEDAQDYRYFPEPDLPPLSFSETDIAQIKPEIPELPQNRRKRLAKEYSLDKGTVELFVNKKELGEYFEKVISEFTLKEERENLSNLIKLTTNYMVTDLQGLLGGADVDDDKFLITPENFSEFISMIEGKKISSKIAKMVLAEMLKTGADPSQIVEEKGLHQMEDSNEIETIIKKIIGANPKAVKDFKNGKKTALQFLVGKLMAETKGRVNPQMANELITKELGG